MAAGKGGSTFIAFLMLVGLVGGYGYWNYQQNSEAEAEVFRPYKGYADGDLEALEAALRQELEALDARYAEAQGHKVKARSVGFGQAQVDEFERVQRASRAKRELGFRASESQATLDQVVTERGRRARLGPPWQEFLKKAFLPAG